MLVYLEAINLKKFFKGVKDLIWRHKLLTIICFLAFVVVLIMMYIFFSMFIGSSGKYGDRLEGIEKVELSKSDLSAIADTIEEKSEVTDASVRIQGKIIYIHIECNRETSLDRAKEIAVTSLDEFSDDEKSFYDIAFSLTQVEVEDTDDQGFVVTGSKNAKLDSVSWIKS